MKKEMVRVIEPELMSVEDQREYTQAAGELRAAAIHVMGHAAAIRGRLMLPNRMVQPNLIRVELQKLQAVLNQADSAAAKLERVAS